MTPAPNPIPIHIAAVGGTVAQEIDTAMEKTDGLQKHFSFQSADSDLVAELRMSTFRKNMANDYLTMMDEVRKSVDPTASNLIAVLDTPLDGKRLKNLFGTQRSQKGLAVFTTHNVAGIILPKGRLEAYFVYYIARYTLGFLCPDLKTHPETRDCVFDRKIHKRDLLKSMGPRALCDQCRHQLLRSSRGISGGQLEALDRLFALAGKIAQS